MSKQWLADESAVFRDGRANFIERPRFSRKSHSDLSGIQQSSLKTCAATPPKAQVQQHIDAAPVAMLLEAVTQRDVDGDSASCSSTVVGTAPTRRCSVGSVRPPAVPLSGWRSRANGRRQSSVPILIEDMSGLQAKQQTLSVELQELRDEVSGLKELLPSMEELRADVQQIRKRLQCKAPSPRQANLLRAGGGAAAAPVAPHSKPDISGELARLQNSIEAVGKACQERMSSFEQQLQQQLDALCRRGSVYQEQPDEAAAASPGQTDFEFQLQLAALRSEVSHASEMSFEAKAAIEEEQVAVWAAVRTLQSLMDFLGLQRTEKSRSKSLAYEAQVLEVAVAQAVRQQDNTKSRPQHARNLAEAEVEGQFLSSLEAEQPCSAKTSQRCAKSVGAWEEKDGHSDP